MQWNILLKWMTSKPPNRCVIFQILSTKKTEFRALMKDRHCLTQGNRLRQGKMSCSALGRMKTSMPRPGASKVILRIQPFISQLRPEFQFFSFQPIHTNTHSLLCFLHHEFPRSFSGGWRPQWDGLHVLKSFGLPWR